MAKMLRRDRARQYLADAFLTNKIHHSGWSHKAKRPDHLNAYWKLIRTATDFGMRIFLAPNLGETTDAFDRPFTIGGQFCRDNKIKLVSRSFSTLAHELAHAVDHILGGTKTRAECELVAAAAGYFLTCEVFGVISPSFDVRYAKRQGATPQDWQRMEEYAWYVFEEMLIPFGGSK